MKIEWNENGFSASMNDEPSHVRVETASGWELLRENGTLILGSIAVMSSILNLLFGLFLNFSTDIIAYFMEHAAEHWMVVLLIFSIILFSMAVLSGIFSIIHYTKSKKKTLDVIGLVLSILAFVVGFSGLVLNIVAIIVW